MLKTKHNPHKAHCVLMLEQSHFNSKKLRSSNQNKKKIATPDATDNIINNKETIILFNKNCQHHFAAINKATTTK